MNLVIVKVMIEDRPDGGIRVWSDDVPGLILSGKDRTRILADIEPAVKRLLEHNVVIQVPHNLRIDAVFMGLDEPKS